MAGDNPINKAALDSLSVTPGDKPAATDDRQNAGQDKSIARRLERAPRAPTRGSITRSMNRWTPPILCR